MKKGGAEGVKLGGNKNTGMLCLDTRKVNYSNQRRKEYINKGRSGSMGDEKEKSNNDGRSDKIDKK